MQEKPHYVYPFRRLAWVDGCRMQTGVILLRSLTPMTPDDMHAALLEMSVASPYEYELLEVSNDTSINLDAWEPFIETMGPANGLLTCTALRLFSAGDHGHVLIDAEKDCLVGSEGIEPSFAP